ncbi:MAG: YlbF family regulator [Clostridia bacterium]|nr:YlbF family regulator [Clostridia bacterium]
MTKIIEIAHMLGLEIAASDEIKALEAAKNQYEANAELNKLMSEYETERRLLGEEFSKPEDEMDEIAIANLRARLEELTGIITKEPDYIAFNEAQQAMNALMAEVNAEIKFCITGERETCTHDCSTCSGCH